MFRSSLSLSYVWEFVCCCLCWCAGSFVRWQAIRGLGTFLRKRQMLLWVVCSGGYGTFDNVDNRRLIWLKGLGTILGFGQKTVKVMPLKEIKVRNPLSGARIIVLTYLEYNVFSSNSRIRKRGHFINQEKHGHTSRLNFLGRSQD